MDNSRDEDTSKFPALGRVLLWVDRPGSANRIFRGLVLGSLALACALVFAAGFLVDMHGHFVVDDFGGFYAIYAFIMFTGLILAAKGLRRLIRRPENYYGDKAVDREPHPEDQLERRGLDD